MIAAAIKCPIHSIAAGVEETSLVSLLIFYNSHCKRCHGVGTKHFKHSLIGPACFTGVSSL